MTREQKVALLIKIAAGQAGPEALRDKRMVHRISGARSGLQNGLYVDGKLSDKEIVSHAKVEYIS